ncbi:unnamed protein product [Calicophoron daubneyi]|uniref:Trafficking protein particle complex subunit 12 n=1 Tax=Calicophoron daubneyi TaxID=300641 RepID=A0AAV2T1P9_CALDB
MDLNNFNQVSVSPPGSSASPTGNTPLTPTSEQKTESHVQKNTLSSYFAADSVVEDPFESVFPQGSSPNFEEVPNPTTTEAESKPVRTVPCLDPPTLARMRQRDAWLPSEATRQGLLGKQRSGPLEIKPMLSGSSHEIGTDTTSDPYRSLLIRFIGDEAAVNAIRRVPQIVDQANPTIDQLKDLIANGWYRAALDLTFRLLNNWGYGKEKGGAELTPFTAQIWLTRLALLVRTRNYDIASQELASFSTLDAPNVYFEHAPDSYPGRTGSIIPFSLRLLHAELPIYLNHTQDALDRLYYLLAVIGRIKSNLQKGYTEDGSSIEPDQAYRESSLSLWTCREVRVLSSCLSVYLADMDYQAAIETVHQMAITCSNSPAALRGLASILGRIYLQLGDLETAKSHFAQAIFTSDAVKQPQLVTQSLFQDALLCVGRGEYEEAKKIFQQILDLDPTNVVAANNLAVCALYLGQLSDAIRMLDTLTTTGLSIPPQESSKTVSSVDVSQADKASTSSSNLQRRFCLHDSLISNLAILYEIESDNATTNKVNLLERLASLPGEPVHASAVKLPTS